MTYVSVILWVGLFPVRREMPKEIKIPLIKIEYEIYHCVVMVHYVESKTCSGGGPIHARVPIHAHP